MLLGMQQEQIAVRLPSELLHQLDELVAEGTYASRAAAVRAGLVVLLATSRERALDRAIVDGYRRVPPSDDELAAAHASMREAIAGEPW
jgi:Arc/MetJ-type ribon-helix-helix transcriptional regulator